MKKFIAALCAALVAAVISVTLAACGGGSGSVAGVYKFVSISQSLSPDEDPQTSVAGDEYAGTKLTEDFVVLELTEDGTFVMSSSMSGSENATGTWKLDGEKLTFEAGEQDGISVDGTLKDGSVTIAFRGEGAPVVVMQK